MGVDAVVVLGGDGTLNEAANGLAGSTTALAALPGGSTNVFSRTIGLPDDPIEATGALLDALGRKAIRRIGLGSVNGRYFLFHVGMGFDAAVVAQVERRSAFKRYASHPLFVYAAFDTALRHYDRSRPRLAVHLADGTVVDDVYEALCFNSNPYTYLGSLPINIAPDASLDRAFTMVSVRTLRIPTILGLVGSALLNNGKRVTRTGSSTTAPTSPRSPSRATARSPTRSTATTSARPTTSSSATYPTASTWSCRETRVLGPSKGP